MNDSYLSLIDNHEASVLAARVRVLLIDDQLIIVEAIRRMLSDQTDIELHYVLDAQMAIDAAVEMKPTLILQDLVMPLIDGLEIVARMRQHLELCDIPIVVLSSKEDPKIKAQSFTAGANDYLVKLPDKIELLARVRYHSKAYVHLLQRNEAFRFLRESQRKLAETNIELQKLVALDGLTGISNRRYFDQSIEEEWMRAKRNGKPISVLFFDVDWFKSYNDTHGHLEGDLCLKRVAAVLTEHIKRPADLVARYGGEEFAMILPETPAEGAAKIAEACRRGVEQMAIANPSAAQGRVTVSVGVACAKPAGDMQSAELMSRADRALYRAKDEGRNRVSLD